MHTVGLLLVTATCLLAPVASWLLWRSAQAPRLEDSDPSTLAPAETRAVAKRLRKSLKAADAVVKDRYANDKKTPTPAFAMGRRRAPVPAKPEARRYM